MKTIRIIPVLAFLLSISTVLLAQQSKTESFHVSGNCGMCKAKIEKAAKEAGATHAEWDVDSKQLTVKYNSASTNAAKIQQQIAGVGYDNAGFKAAAASYDKLHGCCKYDRAEPNQASAKTASCCSGKCEMKDGKCSDMTACKDKGCCQDCGAHEGKHANMDCCKDGQKCTKEGHGGKDCCKKS